MALDPKDYGCIPFTGPDPAKRYDWFGMLIPDHCDRGGECWKGFLKIEVIRWRDDGGTLANLHEIVTEMRYYWNRENPLDCQMGEDATDAELARLLAIKDTLRYSHS